MKYSGIEWVGQIPENWNIHPVYFYFTEGNVKNFVLKEQNLLSLSYGNIIRKDINSNGGLLPASFCTYNIVETGDIIIRPTDLQNDKRSLRTGLVKERGIITSAYIDLKPNKNVNSGYYHYLLHSYDVRKVFYNMGNGVRQGLNYSEFSKLLILEPSAIQQQQIADYLDSKCSEIDSLVSDIEQQITTLEEYKKSVITEAVTKGLNPDVEMKDSGIEWIGKVPKEWKIVPLKYVVLENQFSLNESCDDNFEFNYVDIGSVEYGEGIIQYQKMLFKDSPSRARRIVYENDVIISTVRTYLKAIAVIPKSDIPIIVSTGFAVLTSKEGIDSIYLGYAVQLHPFVSEIESKSFGISYPAINSSSLMNIKILVPDIISQRQIADYLDSKCSEIDSIIADKKQQLEIIKEYKKSLIYEYVTGKKEVPVNVC